jgi:hypothetical protein
MMRPTMALVAFLVFVSISDAGLVRRTEDGVLKQRIDQRLVRTAPAPAANDELVITEQTEVKLDGQTCRYADVPEDAEVVLLELSADKKAVLRIHFRTKK